MCSAGHLDESWCHQIHSTLRQALESTLYGWPTPPKRDWSGMNARDVLQDLCSPDFGLGTENPQLWIWGRKSSAHLSNSHFEIQYKLLRKFCWRVESAHTHTYTHTHTQLKQWSSYLRLRFPGDLCVLSKSSHSAHSSEWTELFIWSSIHLTNISWGLTYLRLRDKRINKIVNKIYLFNPYYMRAPK